MPYDIQTARKFSVAPMLAYTNRHARYLYRLLCPHALIYTEMIHAMAVLSKKRHRHIGYNQEEHPLVIQLAGNSPQELAEAAKICQDYGYDEINLNIGCPSNKVRHGDFGACLMDSANRVADMVSAITSAVHIPVSIKCRLGIDEQDYANTLPNFIATTSQAGCSIYTIHARMAWLKGLSPKQNRDVPPLDYQFVYEIKKQRPDLHITINGGITTVEDIQHHLQYVDGVMAGRIVLSRPRILQTIERDVFLGSSRDVIDCIRHEYSDYAQKQLAENSNVAVLIRPLFSLFAAQPGGGLFRRRLAQRTDLWKTMPQALDFALQAIEEHSLADTRRYITAETSLHATLKDA